MHKDTVNIARPGVACFERKNIGLRQEKTGVINVIPRKQRKAGLVIERRQQIDPARRMCGKNIAIQLV